VVEPQEADLYRVKFGEKVVVLPFSNLGFGSIPARNWVWEDSIKRGFEKHWILDDNINRVRRLHNGLRLPCKSGIAFAATELLKNGI
jgi:hypothetical protein